jgi:hypothetical protein
MLLEGNNILAFINMTSFLGLDVSIAYLWVNEIIA